MAVNVLKFININLHYLFVHMLVYNKHSLFNMHVMNIKVKYILFVAFSYSKQQGTISGCNSIRPSPDFICPWVFIHERNIL